MWHQSPLLRSENYHLYHAAGENGENKYFYCLQYTSSKDILRICIKRVILLFRNHQIFCTPAALVIQRMDNFTFTFTKAITPEARGASK